MMSNPTQDAIQDIIDWIKLSQQGFEMSIERYPDKEINENWHKAVEKCKTVVAALQQYRAEPCEWCVSGDVEIQTKQTVEYEFDDREYTTHGWEWHNEKARFCPSCGRDLRGDTP